MISLLTITEAEALARAALQRSGTGESQAASVARALVAAEAEGQSGHGLRRLVSYCAQVKAGKVEGHAVPQAERVRSAVLRIDAGHGFAFPALDLAIDRLPEVARETGVATAAIRRSHHAGVLGLTVERLAASGFVALMMANTPAAMAPWGGRHAIYGTNPIAFAAPLPGRDPLVIDLSLSKIARGKVMTAQQQGVPIPQDWALDAEGNPTTDPQAALEGTMVPMGDAKGAALALIVELMAGGLTGAGYASEASSLFDDKGGPPRLGQWLLAIDPLAMGGEHALTRVVTLVAQIEDEPNARVPGRRGLAARRKSAESGIEVDDAVLTAIEAL